MRAILAPLLLAIILGSGSLGLAAPRVVVKVAPPAPRKEVVPIRPGPDHVWIGGFWKWDGARHAWVEGKWVPRRPGFTWVPPHWKKMPGGWEWTEGHWRKP